MFLKMGFIIWQYTISNEILYMYFSLKIYLYIYVYNATVSIFGHTMKQNHSKQWKSYTHTRKTYVMKHNVINILFLHCKILSNATHVI